jgi:hypothetical protein
VRINLAVPCEVTKTFKGLLKGLRLMMTQRLFEDRSSSRKTGGWQ